ncbi:hypothetical protein JYT84_00305 [bacterium AH-315-M10]|nr:hypothetical protein [bacterium AH-315-M10]
MAEEEEKQKPDDEAEAAAPPEAGEADSPEKEFRADIHALVNRASRKRDQLERAGEIRRQTTSEKILKGIPLRTGRITGSLFAMLALCVIAISSLTGHMTIVHAMQAGIVALGVFFGIGFFLGHVGHMLVQDYTDQLIDQEDQEQMAPLPMPGDDDEVASVPQEGLPE